LTHALRDLISLKFWPVDPPRQPSQGTRVYAQARQTFSSPTRLLDIFRGTTQNLNEDTITIDARLPGPVVILSPGQPIPITFLIKRVYGFVRAIQVQSVELILAVVNKVEIQGKQSNDKSQFSFFNKRNLNINLPAEREELLVDAADICDNGHIYFPRGFLPSFHSCHITRTYSLIVRVGLLAEDAKKPKQVQLVIAVQVFSGVNRRREGVTTYRVEEQTNPESDGESGDTSLLPSYNDAMNDAVRPGQ
jgi:hypothetical protein